jgi:hypothetical protein
MSKSDKHVITFDAGAKEAIARASDLPDLNTISDEDRVIDICMFFGAAAYYAQFFEAAIADFLIAYRKLPIPGMVDKGTNLDEESLDKNTMGMLLRKLRNHFEIDNEIDSVLSDALTKRNYLMHQFFKKRRSDFSSSENRQQIFSELIQIGLLLKKAMVAIHGMTVGIERFSEDSKPGDPLAPS